MQQGNPLLRPEINHDVSLAAVWKFIQAMVSWQMSKNAILYNATAQKGKDNAIVIYYDNFDRNIPTVQAVISATPTIGIWHPRLTLALVKQWLTMESQGKEDTTMTIAEILKAKGVSDDIIKAVQDDMKANKIFTASEENLDIRYGKLKTDHEGTLAELSESKNLIAELQKSNKGNEEMQKKISEYEANMAKLQAEKEQIELDAAIKIELLSSKALDVDYLTFKLKEKGELSLDENGKIKGWDDKLAGLKTQFPTQFEAAANKNIIENKLPEQNSNGDAITRESLLKKPYAERMKIFNENPEAYKTAMNK